MKNKLRIIFGMEYNLIYSKDSCHKRDVILIIKLSSHFAIRKKNLFPFDNGQADFYFCNWHESFILMTQEMLIFLGYQKID